MYGNDVCLHSCMNPSMACCFVWGTKLRTTVRYCLIEIQAVWRALAQKQESPLSSGRLDLEVGAFGRRI